MKLALAALALLSQTALAAPVIDGERPLLHASFQAPGAPRSAQFGIRLGF